MTKKVADHMTSCATIWLPERHSTALRTRAPKLSVPSTAVAVMPALPDPRPERRRLADA